ncbi:hypothetical protein CLV59_102122 [Chitinophaga dinghuensis]|uniref:Hemerythrin HHE cation binding domain-containing protein n=1 Tax=Chitinophaga dinghuensis TaxID=1539050 RepID=A0A327W4H1_9BACT|nr:hypothetical protein [Chitinophaga dinghuensis]RAJ85419.1 hypothetical protein CLV59_102122 [Chitinophaga dinghuensis]
MHAFAIINFHELSPTTLCDVVVHKFHHPIEQTADEIMTYFNLELPDDSQVAGSAAIQQLLFSRLHAEFSQVIRKEATILYPVIREKCVLEEKYKCIQPATYESIRQAFQKITLLLQKLRQVSDNYQIQQTWSSEYKLCVSNLYMLEQLIQQWLYIEQNILYPTVTKPGTIIVQQDELNNTSSID